MGKQFDPSGEALNNVEKSMNSVGIAIRSNSGTFKSFDTVLEELSGKWNTLNQVQQATAATAIAGTRQHNQFLALMENMNIAMNLQTTEAQSAGNAMQRYGTYAQSTEAKFNDLTNTMQKMWMSLINSSAINTGIGLINGFVKGLSALATSSDGTKTAVITLTAATIALGLAIKSVGGISAISSVIASVGVQAAATATQEAILTSVSVGLTTAIKGIGTALLFLSTTPIGLLITGLGLATAAVLHHVNTLKEQKQAVDDTSNAYKNLNQAIKDNSITSENADLQKLQKQQTDLTNALKARSQAQKKLGDIAKSGNVDPYSSDMQRLTGIMVNANKTINDTENALNGAGVAYNKTTGQIYAVAEAQVKINNNNTVAKIKAESQAEIDHQNQLKSLIQEYQNLSAKENANADTKTRMSQIAKDLSGTIGGLETITDSSGNTTIKNTGLLKDEMTALSSEGDSVKTLTNIKLDAAKQSAKIQIGETSIAYSETGKRIDQILSEISALQSKKQAMDAVYNMEANPSNPIQKAVSNPFAQANKSLADKSVDNQVNSLQNQINQIKQAKADLDKTFSTSSDEENTLPSSTNWEPSGDNSTNIKKEQSAALTAQQRDLENKSRDLTIQSRNLDVESKALDAQSKALNTEKQNVLNNLEKNYKVEQQHIEDIIKGYDKQLDALKEKKQLQDDTNSAIDYQNKLIKDQQDLQNALNEKTVMITDSSGNISYASDQSKVQAAREALAKDQEDYRRWQADQAIQAQEDAISKQIQVQQDAKDASTTAYNNQKDSIDANYQAKLDAIDAQKQSISDKQQSISDARSDLDEQKNSINDSRNTLAGYAEGTENVPQTGQYLVGEMGREIVTLPQGAKVTPNDKTEQLLNSGSSQSQSAKNNLISIGNTIENNKNIVKKPVKDLLNEVDDDVDNFTNKSSDYGKNLDKTVGESVTNNKQTVKKPVDDLITEIVNMIQNFVNNAGQYGQNTDRNIGTGITNTQESVLNPTRTLISNVKGIIDPFVASNIDQGKNINANIGKGISDSNDDLMKNIEDLCKKMVDKFNEKLDIHSPSKVMYKIGQYMIEGLIKGMDESDIEKFITDKVSGMTGSINSQVTNVPGNVKDWIKQAMQLTGTPDSWLNSLVTIAMHESSGNPNDINTYDSNAQAGHPSQGLMQTIPETFQENMLPGHNQILNPVDNTIAAINYIKKRYGDVSRVPGIIALSQGRSYVGYQTGIDSATPGVHPLSEDGRPEIVIGKQNRLFSGGETVLNGDKTKNILQSLMPRFEMPDFSNLISRQAQQIDNSKKYSINNVTITNPNDFNDFVTKFEQMVATSTQS